VIKFRMLLWFLGRMMKKASRKSEEFKKQLAGQDMVFQIQTEDGKAARQFIVKDNAVASKGKAASDPVFTINFRDADTGLRIMTSKDRNAFMKGIQEKDITVTGDLTKFMWFQGVSKYLKP